MTTERVDAGADALPVELDWARLGRRLLVLVAAIAAAAAIVALLPGLGAVRRSLAGARPQWLLLAAVLEVLSCLSYVLVFRAVFCARMPWRASYATAAATAVLAYRAIVLLLPVALGVPALVSLRRRLAGVVAPGRVLVACAEAD